MSAHKAHMALVVDEQVGGGGLRLAQGDGEDAGSDDPAKVTCRDCLRALGRERVHYA